MPFVEIKNLVAGYGNTIVLKGVSLDVEEGEKVAIIGPSGSGKSTLLKCIIRLIEPLQGKIIIDGIDVTSKTTDIRKIRAMTGFVFQHYNLFPHMTVIKNVALPLLLVKKVPKREAYGRAMDALKSVGLQQYADSYPLQLSGGQQQRVAIARALVIEPRLLLLDEPTSALDPELVDEVLDVLRSITKKNMTIILVTHELDFAEDIADRIIFMEDGKIVEEGDPIVMLHNPQKTRTREFLRRIIRKRRATFTFNPNSPTNEGA